jgi:hypothetical protein
MFQKSSKFYASFKITLWLSPHQNLIRIPPEISLEE